MPISWTLQYPFASESDSNLLRTHFEALRADLHVVQFDIGIDPSNPFVRSVHLVLREGCTQPANPDYRFLNLRFPVRSLTPVPSHELVAIIHDSGVIPGVFDLPYTAPLLQHHPEASELPLWVMQGQWARNQETGKCFCISGITAEAHTLFILGTYQDKDEDPLRIALSTFLKQFTSVSIPREALLTSWEVLLRDIDEKY